jgi:AcrR family transcriptional regulator
MVRAVQQMSRPRTTNRTVELAATMFEIIADRGLEAVTVREVAAAAGLSIGAVQHHFPTKDAMLASAFHHVVGRIRGRVARRARSGDVVTDLHAVLTELLPLDENRRREARVQVAFAARAATSADLQAIQRPLLEQIRVEIGAVLGAGADTRDRSTALLALVDGLVLHEVSAPGSLGPRTLERALVLGVRAAVADCCDAP